MLTEDYLMRYIRIATAALAKMVGLKAAGLDQDALFLLDRTLEQILGLRIDLIRSLATRDLFQLLADQERLDPLFLATLGDLFAGEADLLERLDRPVDSQTCAQHSLALYVEAELDDLPDESSVDGKIAGLLSTLKPENIPDETWFALFNYQQERGDLAAACDALEELISHVGYQPDLVDLAREFYTGLLAKTDSELAEAHFTRAEIQDSLRRLGGSH